jgi:RNA polymerase-binding transcription factor DksA
MPRKKKDEVLDQENIVSTDANEDVLSKKRGRPKKEESQDSDNDVTTIQVAAPKDKVKTKAMLDAEERANEEHIAPKEGLRYSDEELEEFKQIILKSKEETLDELTMLRERLDDLNSYDFAEESMIYSMHMAEQGSEAMEKEKTYAQIQRINEYLKKLDDALERIDLKTYGICRVCGCLIAKPRLLAVPITTLSASYKIHKKCPDDGVDRIEPLKK